VLASLILLQKVSFSAVILDQLKNAGLQWKCLFLVDTVITEAVTALTKDTQKHIQDLSICIGKIKVCEDVSLI
jgi:hypothetical protein